MHILVLYNISNNSIKYTKWHDGFTKALDILQYNYDYRITKINFFDKKEIDYASYDVICFKESFNGVMFKAYKTMTKNFKKLPFVCLCISSSNIVPTDQMLGDYHILFYETYWYYKYASLGRHPNAYHAFGIDTDIMKKMDINKVYDVIFIGSICEYKRPLNVLNLNGKKIAIGFKTDLHIVHELEKNSVTVKEFIEYCELSKFYNQSRLCYIPCKLHGGGERAVLEARACGIDIKIEDDNPKLKELLESEIYSSHYYSKQIDFGIRNFLSSQICHMDEYNDVLNFFYNKKIIILQVGAMDGKTFDPIWRHVIKNNKWQLVSLEPIKYQFSKLIKTYDKNPNVVCINKALNYTNQSQKMVTLKNINDGTKFTNGISSFYDDRNSLSKNYWSGRGKILKNYSYEKDIEPYLSEELVECITINEIKDKYHLKRVDILQVDTEGFDYHVLKIVLSIYKPLIINFEWNNLPKEELDKIPKILHDYNIIYKHQDALAILRIVKF